MSSIYLYNNNQQVLCALCGWPMCSEECSQRKPHVDLECHLFRWSGDDDNDDDDDEVIGGDGDVIGDDGDGDNDNHKELGVSNISEKNY